MKKKIQFVTRNALLTQEGIKGIKTSFRGFASPDSFKYECDPDCALGKGFSVEEFLILAGKNIVARESTRNTLGFFAEKWREKF